jgi:hypothetical protein
LAGFGDRRDAPNQPGGRAARHMIKLTETRQITPYLWVHPDEER